MAVFSFKAFMKVQVAAPVHFGRIFAVLGAFAMATPALAQTQHAADQAAPSPGPRLGSSLYSAETQVRGNRVVRSIQANGVVAFGDQMDADAKEVKTIQYMSYSSPEALSKAQQERDYWLRQSEGLRQRQAARDREFEAVKLARQQEAAFALAQAQAEGNMGWRPMYGLRNFPPAQITGVSPFYRGSPGLAGTAGPLLTSGFVSRR
jgi:hypothetical protein